MLDHSSTLCLKTCTTTTTAAVNWGRICDMCRSVPCTVYCRPDAAYLCTACDALVHAHKRHHDRVWVCGACEQAPSAFICKADAASLCVTCDADIHSANPLARRHHRVPVMPIPDTPYGVDSQSGFLSEDEEHEDEDETVSWLLFDGPSSKNNNNNKEKGFLSGGGEEYLEFMEFADNQGAQLAGYKAAYDADSVVPIQKGFHVQETPNRKVQMEMEYETLNGVGYGYHPSLSHSVSMSSIEVGVVPDSTRSEVSISHPRHAKGTIDLFSSPPVQVPTQLTAMDREARVMRYREKKKTRRFEKTIRYASRKAYAETRPRVKGRFAKRINSNLDSDQMFPTNHLIEDGYGIVPSF